MSIAQPPAGMQPWEQLTLFQPDAVTLEMVLHISDKGRFIDGGVRATETLTGACLHTEALHWQPTQTGIAEAVARYHSAAIYWSGAVWYCSVPYRGGEAS